jgi:hypothetical protein
MLAFGVDVPLIEIIFALALIIFILLVETIVILSLLMKQMNKSKDLARLIEKLSDTLLNIKKAEIEELDKLKKI